MNIETRIEGPFYSRYGNDLYYEHVKENLSELEQAKKSRDFTKIINNSQLFWQQFLIEYSHRWPTRTALCGQFEVEVKDQFVEYTENFHFLRERYHYSSVARRIVETFRQFIINNINEKNINVVLVDTYDLHLKYYILKEKLEDGKDEKKYLSVSKEKPIFYQEYEDVEPCLFDLFKSIGMTYSKIEKLECTIEHSSLKDDSDNKLPTNYAEIILGFTNS